MMDAALKRAYEQACDNATESLLRHPNMAMAAQLRALADSVLDHEQRDVYGQGELIASFERQVAALLGKQAALFLPTGTLAQPIALKLWGELSGRHQVAMHPTSHLLLHEHMGIEALWQLETVAIGHPQRPVHSDELMTLDSKQLAALVTELPMREIGGQYPTWQTLVKQAEWAKQHGVRLHLDGARLWQAPAHYHASLAEIAALFDSVYVSFYKDLGGISGAVLAADDAFINEARIWARRAGGNPISLYPELLAARKGLQDNLPIVADAVHYAIELGTQLSALPGVTVTPNPPQGAMFHLHFPRSPGALTDKIAAYIQQHRTIILPMPRSGDEHHSVCEVSIGRNAMSQPPEYWLRHFHAFLQTL